jgi:hypothetical protein
MSKSHEMTQEFWTGGLSLDTNYIASLTSTATGLEILFALLIASFISRKEKVKVSVLELQGSL